jgi:hypothetical protein
MAHSPKTKAQIAAIKAAMGKKTKGPSDSERKSMQEEIREHSKKLPLSDVEKNPAKYRHND